MQKPRNLVNPLFFWKYTDNRFSQFLEAGDRGGGDPNLAVRLLFVQHQCQLFFSHKQGQVCIGRNKAGVNRISPVFHVHALIVNLYSLVELTSLMNGKSCFSNRALVKAIFEAPKYLQN